MNRVEISGGLVRDPGLRFLPSGAALCDLTVAVSDVVYDAETRGSKIQTEYLAVQAWGWLAEQVGEMGLSKGDEVLVVGTLTQQEVEKTDGSKERKTRIRALTVTPTRVRGAGPTRAHGTPTVALPGRTARPPADQPPPWPDEPPPYDGPPFP